MAPKKRSGSVLVLLLIGGIFWLLSDAKKEGWVMVGLLAAAVVLALWWSRRSWNRTTEKAVTADLGKARMRKDRARPIDTASSRKSYEELSKPAPIVMPLPASVIPTTSPLSTTSKVADAEIACPQYALDGEGKDPGKGQEEDAKVQQELTQALSSLLKERIRVSIAASNSGGAEVPIQVQSRARDEEYRLPSRTRAPIADATWIPPGGTFEVGGREIRGGMVYVGTSLPAAYGNPDPCLIDRSLRLAPSLPLSIRALGYWPSYSNLTSSDRSTYLDWLSDGRKDPRADIGFVFLFFYGLERRVLIDAKTDLQAKAELPAIAQEVDRLLRIYGSSHSFQTYATALLDLIRADEREERLYDLPVPDLPISYELPFYLKIVLGQASRDNVPLSAGLALEWLHRDPATFLRTPAQRCPDEFKKHFAETYRQAYGDGMKLPKNRTRLKLIYRPASAGFRQEGDIGRTFSDLSDVTAITGPMEKLRELAVKVTDDLDAYSRFLGRSPELKEKATHLLPFSLWPEGAKQSVLGLKERVASGFVHYTVKEFFGTMGIPAEGSKAELLSLHRVLDAAGIALEPEIDKGAKLPKADEHVVLFAKPDGPSSGSVPYRTAQLTLRLAATMVHADGEFSDHERDYLLAQIASWKDLTAAERARLGAHMHLAALEPVTFAAMKKKLEPLSMEDRERLAEFMATLARMDGVVSPEEVKVLEKAYKALGIDADRVFSDLHATATTGRSTAQERTKGVRLDPARVAALQKDSEKVSQLLASIFKEEEPAKTIAPEDPAEEVEPLRNDGRLWDLDGQHTALAHLLLSRPTWTRQDLDDAAADMDLMLDGALERINEAAFDAHDIPFFEGEDPLEITPEIIEKLNA